MFPATVGQVIVAHALLGTQVALQLHELAHDRSPHAPEPVQVSVHLPVPHVSAPHAGPPAFATHVTSHAPKPQVIGPHA